MSEYANFAAALTEGKILLLADLRGLGETTDPAFYTDAKYWNREYRNAMISMHIGRPIMGQRVVDILTLLDFCSEHELLKGHPVKVFANGIYGPAVIHAAYLDERINSVEITHSVKTWKEYIEKPMQWDMSILNVLKAQQSAPAVDGIYGLSISFPGNQHASG